MVAGGVVLSTDATRRLATLVAACLLVLLVGQVAATAHPLGNFTTNSAVRVVVGSDDLRVRYVLDLAEIPTVQARQEIDADDDGEIAAGEQDAYAAAQCERLSEGLEVAVDGDVRATTLAPVSLELLPGQAGLETTRLVCDATADGVAAPATVTVDDRNGLDRVGWREVTVVADGLRLASSDVPADSPTRLLREYPDASLTSPSRVTSATVEVAEGGDAAPDDVLDPGEGQAAATPDAPEEGLFERLTTQYTDLIAERELTPGFVLLAVLLAVLLGASHAVAPGHGKTVMAAYVVGERGSTRQALAIGATVAMTHTVGTLLLGVALQVSETLAPERLYPVFGLVSGVLIVAIGAGLLRGAWRSRRDRLHDAEVTGAHDHGHDHPDHVHDHEHESHDHDDHDHLAQAAPGTVIRHHGHVHVIPHADMGWRRLIALGVAGGLAPSPSALLVLLGAIALGRTGLGVGLVAAYGLGLALVLVGGGLLLVRFRTAAERLLARRESDRFDAVTTWLPFVTGAAVVIGGVVVAARGVLLS